MKILRLVLEFLNIIEKQTLIDKCKESTKQFYKDVKKAKKKNK